ncbi:MAG: hypothetical protein B7Z68_09185 [Acidobacteria bacterium 21-70-11]|nr:MAG: hypothetical protein B7Z68_09185 [Acidobacteria bacterium 21-70-11]OYW04536.1 MAG: hypothetical protein B7Z61_09290 [Acidobacteria bacterium 37-71-11]
MPLVFVIFAILATVASAAIVFVGVGCTQGLRRSVLAGLAAVALALYAVCLWRSPQSWVVSDTLVLSVAVLAGGLLSLSLASDAAVVAFLTVGAVVDAFSSTLGLTAALLKSYVAGKSHLLEVLSISAPFDGKVIPIVGISDLFFLGVVFSALGRFGHRRAASFLVPTGGLVLALAVAFLTNFVAALPEVALVTIVYLALHRRARVSLPIGTLDHCRTDP